MAVSGIGKHIVKMTAVADSISGLTYIKYIRWVGGANADDSCIIEDVGGDAIFESESDGANFIDIQPIFDWVETPTIDTLSSGTVYIYKR